MGYRSQVRSLIYGPEDKICALVAKHQLDGSIVFREDDGFGDCIRRYKMPRRLYNREASAEAPVGEDGKQAVIIDEHVYEVIDLRLDDVKWYEGYPIVSAWGALLDVAREEFELQTEFVRVGEERADIEVDHNVEDGGDTLLAVSVQIVDEIEELEEKVDG